MRIETITTAVDLAGNQVLWTRPGQPVAGAIVGVLAGLLLRLAADRRDWRLPAGLDYGASRVPGKDGIME